MTTKTLKAFVLHKQWSGDASARVSFLTDEYGLITCLYKGGRSPKKQALLQAFTPLWLIVEARYERFFIKSVENTVPALTLANEALFSGLYVNELLYYALSPAYPDAALFQAYELTLKTLNEAKDKKEIEKVLRRFEWALLQTCGYSFSLTTAACDNAPIKENDCYSWRAEVGFLRTQSGIPGEHLLAISRDCLEEAAVLRSAKLIMRQAIDHLLGGRKLKARELFTKV